MGIKEGALALADELEGMDCREGCSTCPADGTKDCRGDLSCEEAVARATARRIREVVEHDACEDTTVSAYDLLGDEDREALAWVREMGGVEAAKASIHQGAMEHGYLLKVAEILGTSIYDGTGNSDALLDKLEKRLMPEGMEWPKVDGKPVDFKTLYEPSLGVLEAVSIYSNGACEVMGHDGIIKYVNEIHVETPKVLDADGAEIRVNEAVFDKNTGEELIVIGFEDGRVWCEHRMTDADALPVRGMWSPGLLTHERPESWERLEEDATIEPHAYCTGNGLFGGQDEHDPALPASELMARDLVRRARALSERDA